MTAPVEVIGVVAEEVASLNIGDEDPVLGHLVLDRAPLGVITLTFIFTMGRNGISQMRMFLD